MVFEDWKKAWEQAKANFERELNLGDASDVAPGLRASSMRRDLAQARRALERLQADLTSSRHELAGEEEQVKTCQRRASLAEGIGDAETARIALDYARRHSERAAILQRKVDVLQDELAMRETELGSMEEQAAAELAEIQKLEADRVKHDAEFRQLDQQRRERDAEARLEELKKRMK
ncbi:MAG TPA: hypothetical protein VGD27_08350 [Longimicrobiales bacterium]